MSIEIVSATESPIDVISLAAGNCYNKRNVSAKRVNTCVKAGHTSVLEHASVTFRVGGISRACSHQLVRHRMASFCQESQRYCKYDFDGDDWYVMPEVFSGEGVGAYAFSETMREAATNYQTALDFGIKPEDARYLLPEATKTSIVVTMNARELFHFLELRLSLSAQWEIRNMAGNLLGAVAEINDQWAELVDIWQRNQ